MSKLQMSISFDPSDQEAMQSALQAIADHISALHTSVNGLCSLIGLTANAAEAGCLQAPGALRTALLEGAALCLAGGIPNAIEALTSALTHNVFTPPPKGGTHLKVVRSSEGERKAA